ncbi:MAG: DUF4296 domain-containing protein [Prevotellaceae bacterium]|nr:DUF4296 domain-containing protein [Prevotellaceae bacterium]
MSLLSCSGKNTISEKKLVLLLADMHMVDAATAEESFMTRPNRLKYVDSVGMYAPLFKKHDCSYEQFLNTLNPYLYSKDRANNLYGKVVKNLEKKEKRYEKEMKKEHEKQNIWRVKNSYALRGDTTNMPFSIPVEGKGKYILNLNLTLDTLDAAFNPKVSLYLYYEPSDSAVVKSEKAVAKDGTPHNYTLEITNADTIATHIRGYLLDSEVDSTVVLPLARYAEIENITLRYVKE